MSILPDEADPEDLSALLLVARQLADHIKIENDLISMRVQWALAVECTIFAAGGFVIHDIRNIGAKILDSDAVLLFGIAAILIIFTIIIGMLAGISIFAAMENRKRLRLAEKRLQHAIEKANGFEAAS